MNFHFFVTAAGLGIGLAMDAFSVSLANGLNEPQMKPGRMNLIAGIFGGFQTAMPLIGWVCVRTVASLFTDFRKLIPWIAFILLAYIGGKMLIEGIRSKGDEGIKPAVSPGELMMQGVATSIDALSVGFTIASLNFSEALIECLIIGIVTFAICIGGLLIGRKAGTKLSGKASILGGAILVAIGLEIFISGLVG